MKLSGDRETRSIVGTEKWGDYWLWRDEELSVFGLMNNLYNAVGNMTS